MRQGRSEFLENHCEERKNRSSQGDSSSALADSEHAPQSRISRWDCTPDLGRECNDDETLGKTM